MQIWSNILLNGNKICKRNLSVYNNFCESSAYVQVTATIFSGHLYLTFVNFFFSEFRTFCWSTYIPKMSLKLWTVTKHIVTTSPATPYYYTLSDSSVSLLQDSFRTNSEFFLILVSRSTDWNHWCGFCYACLQSNQIFCTKRRHSPSLELWISNRRSTSYAESFWRKGKTGMSDILNNCTL